ncbi:MAG: hypothetical protein GY765_10805 [bacterium]|nr:hypothetical protein [bacterium]
MALPAGNDFFILKTLKDCLKLPYTSVFRSASGIRKMWREIIRTTGRLERVLETVDISQFNPPVDFDEQLDIPYMTYGGEAKGTEQGAPRDLRGAESPGTTHRKPSFPGVGVHRKSEGVGPVERSGWFETKTGTAATTLQGPRDGTPAPESNKIKQELLQGDGGRFFHEASPVHQNSITRESASTREEPTTWGGKPFKREAPAPPNTYPPEKPRHLEEPSAANTDAKGNQNKVKESGALVEKLLQSIPQEENSLLSNISFERGKKEFPITLKSSLAKSAPRANSIMTAPQKPGRHPANGQYNETAAHYVSTLQAKRNKRIARKSHLPGILDSAFKQRLFGSQASLASFFPPSLLEEFKPATDEMYLSLPMEEGPDSFEQEFKPSKIEASQKAIDTVSGRSGGLPSEPLNAGPLSKGFQLLESLTLRWTEKVNQEPGKVSMDSAAQRSPENRFANAPTIGNESVRNLVNLTVQMQNNGSQEDDLENVGEKVNRILMEQARRYGIDLS